MKNKNRRELEKYWAQQAAKKSKQTPSATKPAAEEQEADKPEPGNRKNEQQEKGARVKQAKKTSQSS